MTTDPDAAPLPYRPCAGIMLVNKDNLIFVGQRLDGRGSGIWQMPQGGIDPGEDPDAAANPQRIDAPVSRPPFHGISPT